MPSRGFIAPVPPGLLTPSSATAPVTESGVGVSRASHEEPRRIGLLVYPGFDLLDLCGPLEAFYWAGRYAAGSYQATVMSLDGGVVQGSALPVVTEPLERTKLDTLLVIGGRVDLAIASPPLVAYVREMAPSVRRIASVCNGALLLAEAGLLDGRTVTTHWYATGMLQAAYPKVRVHGDRIFVKDGNVWSSAGISAGIDLALALIEEDLGRDVAVSVARMLVVYLRRSGGQFQHSVLLEHDAPSDSIQRVLSYAREHLRETLTVEHLATVAHLSLRQFSRLFRATTGTTPAKAIERLRVEAARPQIESGRASLEEIARDVGFSNAAHMRQSFVRVLGEAPQAVRLRVAARPSAPR